VEIQSRATVVRHERPCCESRQLPVDTDDKTYRHWRRTKGLSTSTEYNERQIRLAGKLIFQGQSSAFRQP